MKVETKDLASLWPVFLAAVAILVIVNVNFGFQEKMLKEELIEHTAFRVTAENMCICPSCGGKGFTYCARCGRPMRWDRIKRYFTCLSCSQAGNPVCGRCGAVMQGIRSAATGPGGLSAGRPVPVF